MFLPHQNVQVKIESSWRFSDEFFKNALVKNFANLTGNPIFDKVAC